MDGQLEPVGISPRVDCVFRQIFEDAELLLSFLNAVLHPRVPLAHVALLNPQILPRQLDGRTATLDVKATDEHGRIYQIEMQSWNETALRSRMLHTWAALYTRQLSAGQSYRTLQPAIAIWLLNQNLFRSARTFHHRFCVHDPVQGTILSDHLELHALELERWRKLRPQATAQQHLQGWLAFFSGAEQWAAVPEDLASPQLEKAMSILERFKENREWFERYSSEIDFQRRQAGQREALEETEQALTQARELLQGTRAELQGTQAELQGTQTELQGTQAELQGTQAELQGTQAELQGTQTELQGTQAELAAARAREAKLRAMLAELQAGKSES